MKNIRKIALWIFVGLLSLGQLQRIELHQFSASFYIHDIFIIFWIFHIIFTSPVTFFDYIFEYFKKEKIAQIFSAVAVLSSIINIYHTGDFISLLYISRLFVYIIFGFSLLFLIKNNKLKREYTTFQFFSIGILSLFLGFLQYVFIPDTRFLSVLGWDDHYARLISTYFDPGFTGILFLLTALIGLSSKYLQNKKIQLFIILLFSWGIILTFSRASYIALFMSFLILAVTKIKLREIKFKYIIFGMTIFLFLIFLAPKPFGEGVDLLRTASISARKNAIAQQVSSVSLKTVFVGNGLFSEQNSLNYRSDEKNQVIPSHSRVPDNLFITVFLSTGVFGFALFVVLLVKWAKKLKSINSYMFAGFVSLLIHAQFSNSLLQPFVLLVFLGGIASMNRKPL